MTITKNSLVNLLHDEVGLNKREAKEFIETFFEVIKIIFLTFLKFFFSEIMTLAPLLIAKFI